MSNVICPATYFPSLSFGRPVSLGSVYVFQSGVSVPSTTASVSAGDLVDVFYRDEGDNEVEVSQPLQTTKGGVLAYGSSDTIRNFYSDSTSFIVAAYDASGALQYFGNVDGSASDPLVNVTDWDLALDAGRYFDAGGAANAPTSSAFIGQVIADETGSNLTQILADTNDENGVIYVRVRSLGIFGDWRSVWDSESLKIQSSSTDQTAGAAMLVGAFGLGGYGIRLAGSANSITWFGLSAVESTATDCPSGATLANSLLLSMPWGATNQTQLFFEAVTGNQWQRTYNASWGDWQRIGKTALANKSANYQITSGDFGSVIRFSGGTTNTLTLPISVGYDGGLISVVNQNSGDLSIALSGTTLTWLQGGAVATGARTVRTGSQVTLTRISSTEYLIAGNGIA